MQLHPAIPLIQIPNSPFLLPPKISRFCFLALYFFVMLFSISYFCLPMPSTDYEQHDEQDEQDVDPHVEHEFPLELPLDAAVSGNAVTS